MISKSLYQQLVVDKELIVDKVVLIYKVVLINKEPYSEHRSESLESYKYMWVLNKFIPEVYF